MASLAAAGEITHENISLSAPGGNISIHNTALNTYYTDSSGDIVLHGGVINMDSSTLNAVTVDRQGGDISVVADALHLQNTWFDNSSEGRGNSGNIYLKTVQLTDLSTGAVWGLYGTDVPNCESSWNGAANTASIIAAGVEAGSAAQLCDAFEAGGFTDWYLPAIDELNLMYNAKYNLNQSLSQITGGAPFDLNAFSYYWSSSEINSDYAWRFVFNYGSTDNNVKSYNNYVRAVRAF